MLEWFTFITVPGSIDPSHKSHNASDKYPTMHHFVTEMCTHVHISVTKMVQCWICATGLLQPTGLSHVTSNQFKILCCQLGRKSLWPEKLILHIFSLLWIHFFKLFIARQRPTNEIRTVKFQWITTFNCDHVARGLPAYQWELEQ